MPEPLDYFTPKPPDAPVPAEQADAPPAAIPIEFDALLTRTPDLAAARAVERELARHGIRFFRTEGAALTNRQVELHVASADHPRAAHLAAMIFARRRRLDAISPRRRPADSLISPHGAGDGLPSPGSF